MSEQKGISILYRQISGESVLNHIESELRTFSEIQRSIQKFHQTDQGRCCMLLDSAQKEIEISSEKNSLTLKFLGKRADVNILRKVFMWLKDTMKKLHLKDTMKETIDQSLQAEDLPLQNNP